MIYLHPHSQRRIQQYLVSQPQSLLMVGEHGIGFGGAIDTILSELHVTPYIVRPEGNTITAETIRSLYDFIRGRSLTKRVVIIYDADAMSLSAQNAFLKMLEEPSASTYYILTTHMPSALIPTVHSRITPLKLEPISPEQTQTLLDELDITDTMKRQQLVFIAEGLPALLTNLATKDELFQLRAQQVRDARTILRGTLYEKLQVANGYKDRNAALTLLSDAAKLLRHSTSQTNAGTALKHLDTFLKSYERIEANGNVRLWLTMAVV